MLVQKYLAEHGIEKLCEEFGINVVYNDDKTLLKLNYDQIESSKHKYHPIVRECRGIILENGSYEIVAATFQRFFNLGEQPEVDKLFDWEKATVDEKCDGSLIMLYFYKGKWSVATRGSFATGIVSNLSPLTWRELFLSTVNQDRFEVLCTDYTYVFELMSFLNMVVVKHEKTHSKLLGIFSNSTGEEILDYEYQKTIANELGIEVPKRFDFTDISSLLKYIGEQTYSFEGVVAKVGDHRIKVKNPLYVAVHHLRDNVNSAGSLVSLILAGEKEEFSNYFPAFKEKIEEYDQFIEKTKKEIDLIWEKSKDINNQKEFALQIKDFKFCSLLFNAKKMNKHPLDFKESFEKLIIQNLKR